MERLIVYTPLTAVVPETLWPHGFFDSENETFLGNLACVFYEQLGGEGTIGVFLRARVISEARLGLSFLPGLALVLREGTEANPGQIDVDIQAEYPLDENPRIELAASSNVLGLGIGRDLLEPGELVGKMFQPTGKDFVVPIPLELLLSYAGDDWSLDFRVPDQGGATFDLPTCRIGGTNVFLSAKGASFSFNETGQRPAGTGPDWRGVYLKEVDLRLPEIFDGTIKALDFGIGAGGVYGRIETSFQLDFVPGAHPVFQGDLVFDLFGFPGGISKVLLGFNQNVPTAGAIYGSILLPYFDHPLDVEIGLDAGRGLSLSVRGDAGRTIKVDDVFELEIADFELLFEGGRFAVKLDSKLTPLFGANEGLGWPAFEVKDLIIGADGQVKIPGGWLNLREQKSFNFYGFNIEIAQLGFGITDDGEKWVGFSGGLKLVEGLQAGASVEGLRLLWKPGQRPRITLNGLGVELAIPGVLHLNGSVAWNDTIQDGQRIRRFDGDVHLELESPDLKIDGTLVVGSAEVGQGSYNFFAVYCSVDLPTGIPLASTGLSIYGFAGLLALEMEPNKKKDESWFSIDHEHSYFHRPLVGITDLENKWDPRRGSFALGAGLTLGTTSDNGYAFNGKFLLAIVLPGPVLLLQGAASLLTKRGDSESEGHFRALGVFDGRAETLLFGLDASYKNDKKGEMIEIGGSAETFFSFGNPDAWYINLGKEFPREQRIRALFGRFVQADAFFMLSGKSLAMGVSFGYSNSWQLGPLFLELQAWASGRAELSFNPAHFSGEISLQGSAELRVFGFALGLWIGARIQSELTSPYHLRGEFRVGIRIPFRRRPIEGVIVLEWGPDSTLPPVQAPVVDIGIEHLKSAVAWQLPRGAAVPDLESVPRVPLDSVIAITFARPVHNLARAGASAPVDPPQETISHTPEYWIKYSLKRLELSRSLPGGWEIVAESLSTKGLPELTGSWAPFPISYPLKDQPTEPRLTNTKLLLGVQLPFEANRFSDSWWEQWIAEKLPGFPCPAPLPERERCFDFEGFKPGTPVQSPWIYPGSPAIEVTWSGAATVRPWQFTMAGTQVVLNALTIEDDSSEILEEIWISPAEPVKRFRILMATRDGQPFATAFDSNGQELGRFSPPTPSGEIVIEAQDGMISKIKLEAGLGLRVGRLCFTPDPEAGQGLSREENVRLLRELVGRWRSIYSERLPLPGLEPNTLYRIAVETEAQTNFERDRQDKDYAYFHTGRAPGFEHFVVQGGGSLVLPGGADSGKTDTGLDDLSRYVRETAPPSVPPVGEKPLLYRCFYRSYDLQVDFDEIYVESLYQRERCNLALVLFDAANRPWRNEQGLIASLGRWDQEQKLRLSEREKRWLELINGADCLGIELRIEDLRRNSALVTSHQARVLPPDTLFEARLIPLTWDKNLADLRLEDLRPDDPIPFRFQFLTSRFTSFRHHLHGFSGATWPGTLDASAAAALAAAAVPPSFSPPQEPEARAYEDLAGRILGPAAFENPSPVEISRLERPGRSPAFHLRSPEPLDWSRIEISLRRPLLKLPPARRPGNVQLVEASFSRDLAADESLSLLLGEAGDLSHHRIEARAFPGLDIEALKRLDLESGWSFFADDGRPEKDFWQVSPDVMVPTDEPPSYTVPSGGLKGPVSALCLAGEDLYVGYSGGTFNPLNHNGIAIWNGASWAEPEGFARFGNVSQLASGNARVFALEEGKDVLISPDSTLWMLDRETSDWSDLAADIDAFALEGDLLYLSQSRRTLKVTPNFSDLKWVWSYHVGVLNWRNKNVTWLGDQFDGPVSALATDGARIFAAGAFKRVDGKPAGNFAVWNGSNWDAPAGFDKLVTSLCFIPGKGLFAGGHFTTAGTVPANRIARLSGPSWEALEGGVDDFVYALAADVDRLWVGGDFKKAGGKASRGLAIWDLVSEEWITLAAEPDGPVEALAVTAAGAFVGGSFNKSGSLAAAGVAQVHLGRRHVALVDPPVEEFRLAARFVPGYGLAGVVLGWQDYQNFLAIGVDAAHRRCRCFRVVKGVTEVLWEARQAVQRGQEYILTADAIDGNLVAYLDGTALFELPVGPPRGLVGFFVWNSSGSKFRELLIGEPEWTTWHTFGKDEKHATGRRLRIHAGLPDAARPAEGGLTIRASSLTATSTRPRLPAYGAAFRLVSPDHRILHERGFVTDRLQKPLEMRIVRKADGTGFFFFSPELEEDPDWLVLDLLHHRDRGEAQHQEGDQSPERVQLMLTKRLPLE